MRKPRRRWLLAGAAALLLLYLLTTGVRVESVQVWARKPVPAVAAGTLRGASVRETMAPGEIRVLSNRADLISAGDALVEIVLPPTADPFGVRVEVEGRDVTGAFERRDDGRYVGLVTGLVDGPNELTAHVSGVGSQRIAITNHPRGGPVFSGPQLQPWICTTQDHGLGPALDAQCNAPTRVVYVYQPIGKEAGDYQDYDPKNPPNDVATIPVMIALVAFTIGFHAEMVPFSVTKMKVEGR